ncbi:MAG: DUF378 domain-containing protein [Candidatus Micrarchaeia archaeon]
MATKMGALDMVASGLVIIGGLNWGLIGIANVNIVQVLFGSIPMLVSAIYVLVGLSAIYVAYMMSMMK